MNAVVQNNFCCHLKMCTSKTCHSRGLYIHIYTHYMLVNHFTFSPHRSSDTRASATESWIISAHANPPTLCLEVGECSVSCQITAAPCSTPSEKHTHSLSPLNWPQIFLFVTEEWNGDMMGGKCLVVVGNVSWQTVKARRCFLKRGRSNGKDKVYVRSEVVGVAEETIMIFKKKPLTKVPWFIFF